MARTAVFAWLTCLTLRLGSVLLSGAPVPYASGIEGSPPAPGSFEWESCHRLARERQELHRKRVPIPQAVRPDIPSPSAARRQMEAAAQAASTAAAAPISRQELLLASLFLLIGIAGVRVLSPEVGDYLNRRFNPWALGLAPAAGSGTKLRVEEEAFSEFLTSFRTGPTPPPARSAVDATATVESGFLKMFLAEAPRRFGELQELLERTRMPASESARRSTLADLHQKLRDVKDAAGLAELLPAWQTVSAVEGLVKQLTDRAGNLTPSTLRTVAGGASLLEKLCVPGLRPDLLTQPPLRLLAVDDDPISRKAVSLALKKALSQPDLAENGEAALALTAQHAYDVIFLDVQMPGMDGFELCTKLHETVLNRDTPVVFVTCHSDFESRAKSALCGGSDLIGKPFLTFEITVKALTLALEARLAGRAQTTGVSSPITAPSAALAASRTSDQPHPSLHEATLASRVLDAQPSGDSSAFCNSPARAPVSESGARTLGSGESFPHPAPDTAPLPLPEALPSRGPQVPATNDPVSPLASTAASPTAGLAAADESAPDAVVREFLSRAKNQLDPLQDLIQTIFETPDAHARQDMLADFYLRLDALKPGTDAAKTHPALQMTAALQGLLRKILEQPKHCTASVLLTLTNAVHAFRDLCATDFKASRVSSAPLRMLVVDDDAVARRAIGCSLQMAFEKPESADSGEAALALAREKPFDVIFLDVLMPGMDGFTTCLRIHETDCNRSTPVVFVTGHSDFKARSQASVSGGCDLIAKPFLAAEVTVKALTLALRGELQRHKTAQNLALFSSEPPPPAARRVPAQS